MHCPYCNLIQCREEKLSFLASRNRSRVEQRAAFPRKRYFLKERIEFVEVNRLHQVMRETNVTASPNVFFHPVTRQGDAEDLPLGSQCPKEIGSAAIGQTDIT